jgi:acyl-CoA reductase-like NAD-dependent aldehyde dehydrogenase
MGLRFFGPVVFIRPLETREAVELANASFGGHAAACGRRIMRAQGALMPSLPLS